MFNCAHLHISVVTLVHTYACDCGDGVCVCVHARIFPYVQAREI